MQLVKQISIDTPLGAIIADPEVSPSKTLEGFLAMTGSNFTRLAAHLGIDRIILSRIVNGHYKNQEILRKHQQRIADALGWPFDLLWGKGQNEAPS